MLGKTITVISIACFYLHHTKGSWNENPLVLTPYGKVLGSYSESSKGRIYSEFFSIPYAQPPVGELRFKEPQPLQKWDGTWIANFTTECAQWAHHPNGGEFIGQEDCLHLNIFVPRKDFLNIDTLLDVIVDIHGGGLNFGSNSLYTGPKHLMNKDIVFVAINYRLGPFGFLSTEDAVVPGNNGLKDQSMALKWIKANIKYFGGNPESITLTGLSAGGSSVHLHYMSPLSEGLFKGGISLSGTALCPWPMQENALKQTRQLAKILGCTQKSTSDLIHCLRQRSAVQICESTQIFRPWLYNPFSVFGFVVETHGKNPFLNEHPYQLLAKGKIQDLPWITSVVAHEGLYPVAEFLDNEKYLEHLEKNWEHLASHILHYEHTVDPKLKTSVAKKIKEHYFNNKSISFETSLDLIQVASDRLFYIEAERAARLQAKINKSPTYFYYFSYESEVVHSFMDILEYKFTKRPGICHGDDLAFIFNCPLLPLKPISKRDLEMQEILLKIWTSFASSGKPTVSETEWKPVSNRLDEPLDYLHINSPNQIIMKQTDELGNRHFWDSFKFAENNHLFPSVTKDEL